LTDGSTSALRFRQSLTGLQFPLSREKAESVQACVVAFVDDMKAQGWPAERIIVALKRLANDAGLYVSPRVVWAPEVPRGADSLMIDMVGWCIQRYTARAESDAG